MHTDYCFGDVKFGGNAQAITKQRFLHHTSLLWDYQSERMRLLKHPAKIPDYRAVIQLTMQEGPVSVLAGCQARQHSQVTSERHSGTFPGMH